MKEKWLKVADLESKLPRILQMGVDEKRVRELNKLDPTGNIAEYTEWIVKMDRNLRRQNRPGILENDELRHELEQALSLHNRLKKTKDMPGEGKDINKFKTVDDFLKFMQPIIAKFESKQLKPLTDPSKLPAGAEIIYDKPPYTVIRITDAKVMQDTCSLLNITEVCVSGSAKYGYSLRYAEDYLQVGPLYIILKNRYPYAVASHGGEIRDPFDRLLFPEPESLEIFKELGIGYEQFMEFVKKNLSVSIPPDMMSDRDRVHFAEYFAKEYDTLSDRGKLFILTYNKQFRKGREDEIKEIARKLLDQGYIEDVFIVTNKFSLEDVKDYILQKATSDSEIAYIVAETSNFKDVPNEIIQSISKDSDYSYRFAIRLLESGKDIKDIPKEIIQSMSQNSYYSRDIAKKLLESGKDIKEIPDEIIRGVSKDSYYSYDIAKKLLESGKDIKDIPNELIQGISEKPHYYGLFLLRTGKDIKDIPKEIIQEISEDPDYSYWFAEELLKLGKDIKEIPKEVIQSISKDSWDSYNFAIELLKHGKDIKDTPKEIIQSASQYPDYSYDIAKKLLESGKDIKDIPNELIQSVSGSSKWSYKFSQYLNFDKSKIPPEIQESAKKYEYYRGEFEKQGSLRRGGISVRDKWLRTAQTEGEEQKKTEEKTETKPETQSTETDAERLKKISEMVTELRDILKWYQNVSIPDEEGKNIAGWLEKQFKEKYGKTSTRTDVSDIIDKVAFSAANTYMSGIKWVSGQWQREDRDKVKNAFKKYLEWYAKSATLPQRQTPEEIKRKRKIDEALGFLTEEVVKKKLEQKEDALDELLKHVKKKSFYVEAMVKQDVIDTIQNIFGPDVLTREIEDLVDEADRLFEREHDKLVFDVTLSETAIKRQLREIADQIAKDTARQLDEIAREELGKTFPNLYPRVYNVVKSYLEGKIERRFGSKSKWLS